MGKLAELAGALKKAADIPDQVMVDGVMRVTRNSRGQLIHPTSEGIENFWRYYKAGPVDDVGRPVVGYHGSPNTFDTFDMNKAYRENNWSLSSDPDVAKTYQPQNVSSEKLWRIYNSLDGKRKSAFDKELSEFTDSDIGVNREAIEAWAETANGDDPQLWAGDLSREIDVSPSEMYDPAGGQLIEAYVGLQNPHKRWFEGDEIVREEAPGGVPDGYIDYNVSDTNSPRNLRKISTVYHANTSNQIKSATGNSGAFDPNNPSIIGAATIGGMATAGAVGGAALAAQYNFGTPDYDAKIRDFVQRRQAKSQLWKELREAGATIASAIPAGIVSDAYRLGGYLLPNYSPEQTEQGAQQIQNALTYQPTTDNRFLNALAEEVDQFGDDVEPLVNAWQQTPIYQGYKQLPDRLQGIIRTASDYAF